MIIQTKVKGKILFFDDVKHSFYDEQQRKIKSVTYYSDCLDKPGLIYWAVGCMEDYLLEKLDRGEQIIKQDILEGTKQHTIKKTDAANIGKIAHDWIQNWIDGKNPSLPDNQGSVQAINRFLEWNEDNKVKWLKEGEKIVWSQKYNYAGLFDRRAIIKKKRVLVDFKTSNDLRPAMAAQLAGYQIAEEEMGNPKVDERLIIRISKETEDEYHERKKKVWAKRKYKFPIPLYKPFEDKVFTDNDKDKKWFLSLKNAKDREDELINLLKEF